MVKRVSGGDRGGAGRHIGIDRGLRGRKAGGGGAVVDIVLDVGRDAGQPRDRLGASELTIFGLLAAAANILIFSRLPGATVQMSK